MQSMNLHTWLLRLSFNTFVWNIVLDSNGNPFADKALFGNAIHLDCCELPELNYEFECVLIMTGHEFHWIIVFALTCGYMALGLVLLRDDPFDIFFLPCHQLCSTFIF